jgi:hypothetical protein
METESSSQSLKNPPLAKSIFNIMFSPEISNFWCLELITASFFNTVSIVFYSQYQTSLPQHSKFEEVRMCIFSRYINMYSRKGNAVLY